MTARTVTTKGVPAVWGVGVPVLPVPVPGAKVSPGKVIRSLEKPDGGGSAGIPDLEKAENTLYFVGIVRLIWGRLTLRLNYLGACLDRTDSRLVGGSRC